MRCSISIVAGGLAAVACGAATLQVRAGLDAARVPERLPAAWTGSERGAWIFVRPGCGHCAAHLAALERAAMALDPAARRRLLGRVRVVGGAERVPLEARREPDAFRRALGVGTTPTTLLVEPDGRVREAWRGPRNATAWARALVFLDDRRSGP